MSNAQEDELTLEELVQEVSAAHDRTLSELQEIDVLIKQSSAEVQSLAQRNARASNHLRQLQTNFDTIPRQDIKDGYEQLISAQQRLFTMRGQLEKLQSDKRNLQRLSESQQLLLELAAGMTELPARASATGMDLDIVQIIEREDAAHQNLVRRMHDGPASSLSNFILQAEICQRVFDHDAARSRQELDALKQSAGRTFDVVKGFIFDLRPMMLDDLGVVATLNSYVEAVNRESSAEISLATTGSARRLARHLEVTIFRGIQELLTNALNHAQASEIQLALDMDDQQVTASVEDNGVGFDTETAFSKEPHGMMSLVQLRERVERLGGSFTITSMMGSGSKASFELSIGGATLAI
ncbi:MAG: ATP-binding protein [Candidatus Promineifilaceae bacterium]|nr:ATP-binding protein [Candidatus Promineifilaceae bacterium]